MFSIYILILTISCCLARELPTINLPNQGSIIGREVSKLRVQKIIGYYGIPYAKEPLEGLRFAPPDTENLPAWDGVKNATEYAPSCLQTKEDLTNAELPFLQLLSDLNYFNNISEDCLYLNVFVPIGNAPLNGFATIIWFHPGNFTTGTPVIWNPHTIVYRQRVIMVTVSFRLNIMGFFSTMDGEAPGNFGLMDQQAAMKWVKNNIKLFGGNPDNICLMGYGTGAISVGLHMINSESKGYFNKAIAMSGNLLSPTTVQDKVIDKTLYYKLKDFGCNRNPTSQFIECLRRADPRQLVEHTADIDWRPLNDTGLSNSTSAFLLDLPRNLFEQGDFHQIPFLTGYTNMERILEIESVDDQKIPSNISNEFIQDLLAQLVEGDIPSTNNTDTTCKYNYDHLLDAVLFFYEPASPVKDVASVRKLIADFITEKDYAASTFLQASYTSKFQPTYMYRFDMKPSTAEVVKSIPEWVSVPHLFDLLYVWGVPYWEGEIEWDIRDKRISDTVMSFWTNFAKTSDPTENSIYPIKWDKFTEEAPGILIIDSTFNMSNDKNLNYKAFEFWNDYYPKVAKIAMQCYKSEDSGTWIYSPNHVMIFIVVLGYFTT